MIAALVLAAGGSSRLGRPKQLEPWGETTLLGNVVAMSRSFPVDEIWVVLGAEAERVQREVDLTECGVIENPEWEEGMASSLRAGIDALSRLSKADAALIVLGDQPGIDPEVVATLVAERGRSNRLALIPKYRYTWGHPVLVERQLWPRLMALSGDVGAKPMLAAHPEWVDEVWFDTLAPRDVDTPADVIDLRPRE